MPDTPEIELEPDRHRLHDLVRLTWESAQPGVDLAVGTEEGPRAVTDQEIADAGPYSVQQIRDHLVAEQEGTYSLDRDGDTLSVTAVQEHLD